MTGMLRPLQVAILKTLADVRPRWTLSGGGALAGFWLAHRTTRDVDLFWHGHELLEGVVETCRDLLLAAGFSVDVVQRARSFARLQVSDGNDVVTVDLIAEPVPAAEPPAILTLDGVDIQVDGRHEVLVNKLGCLLHRAELRDLVDLRTLLETGGDLERAMRDAAAKNGGFSPLTLGWMLASFPLRQQTAAEQWDDARTAALEQFLAKLADRVARLAGPSSGGSDTP